MKKFKLNKSIRNGLIYLLGLFLFTDTIIGFKISAILEEKDILIEYIVIWAILIVVILINYELDNKKQE
jgi:hypothetical protein